MIWIIAILNKIVPLTNIVFPRSPSYGYFHSSVPRVYRYPWEFVPVVRYGQYSVTIWTVRTVYDANDRVRNSSASFGANLSTRRSNKTTFYPEVWCFHDRFLHVERTRYGDIGLLRFKIFARRIHDMKTFWSNVSNRSCKYYTQVPNGRIGTCPMREVLAT